MSFDPYRLPADLPVPVDDGACAHLPGLEVPPVVLPATVGADVDLGEETVGTGVLFFYPRTGTRLPTGAWELIPGWDDVPGARGCTVETCAFRDLSSRFERLGVRVIGISSQSHEQQLELAAREQLPFPLASDAAFALASVLGLPTFSLAGLRSYRRFTLVVHARRITKVFYPVFPPDRHAYEVVTELERSDGVSTVPPREQPKEERCR